MTDKDPKDMTASELMRYLHDRNSSCSCSMCNKVLNIVGCGEHVCADAYEALADKIDAELAEARKDAIRESKKPMWWFRSAIEHGEDWPEPRDGEKFRDYLHRCFIPRPRYEDGEPVPWCDEGVEWNERAFAYFNAVNQSGVPLAVGSCEVIARAEMTEDGRVKRAICKALGADGLPIMSDEVVFLVPGAYSDGLPPDCGELVVVDTKTLKPLVALRSEPFGERELYRVPASSLTHTPPDTQDRIDEDVAKGTFKYWGCSNTLCCNCSALVGGKKPWERLGTEDCHKAMVSDLLRRQRELDKRTGGEQ